MLEPWRRQDRQERGASVLPGGLETDRPWDQLCELSKVLGSCGEVEFVGGTTRSSQSKTAEPKNALEADEQLLDLPSKLA